MASEELQDRIISTAGSMVSEGGFLERGDAPAQAVLHSNAQAMALRKAAETQEELGKITDRVDKTLSSYILADSIEQPITGADINKIKDTYVKDRNATLELVDDLTQLIIILSDPIAKKKYQQQVTIFIVGYENLCGNRVKILSQLNEFFIQNSKDEDAYDIEYPDFDIEEVGKNVRTALDRAEKAHERLNAVSTEVIKVLETVNPKEAKSRKKKLEKAIIQSRDDIIQLTEKLTSVQKELEANEGKSSQLYKTLEGKQMEIEKLKGHVEMGKRKAQELDELKSEAEQKNATILKMRQEMDKLKLLLAHAEDKHEHVSNKQKESREKQQRMQSDLEERVKEQQQKVAEIRKAMETQHDQELKDLRTNYQTEMSEIKSKYEQEIFTLKESVALTEKQRDDAEKERAELQRFTTSFFNEDTEKSRSASKLSWKSSAKALRLTTAKKSQTLGTDSLPSTPKKALQTDGSIASLKSKTASDLKTDASQLDRSNTEASYTGKFPGTPAAATPATPAAQKQPDNEHRKVSFTGSSVSGTPGLPSSPEKSMGSRGRRRTGKLVQSRSNLSRTSSKPLLSTQEEAAAAGLVEMIDEAIQTEVTVPEKKELDSDMETAIRRLSLNLIPEDAIKDIDSTDFTTNWEDFPIQEIPARFAHYRKLAQKKEEEMLNELTELRQKHNNKVQALKGMMDLRNNWTTEREELVRQLETGKAMKEEAENEAELAMLQLEEMLVEKEELREEIERKTQALVELQIRASSPIEKAPSLHEIGVGTEQFDERPSDNESQMTTRPMTVPTIIQSDDFTSEVIHEGEAEVTPGTLTHDTLTHELPERIMSARARTRLVNSALSRHPVAREISLNYKRLLAFKEKIVEILNKEFLEDEATQLSECEVVPIDETNSLSILEKVSEIRNSTTEIIDCLSRIIPGLITSEDILYSTLADGNNGDVSADSAVKLESAVDLQESLVSLSDNKLSAKVKGQDSQEQGSHGSTNQIGVQTLSEPRKSISQLSSDESNQTLGAKQTGRKEGRKKLVADYKELINKHQELTELFENLTRDTKTTTASYEQQLSQNALTMQEMQDAINELQEQLQSYQVTHPLTVKSAQIKSPDFMFTRLDMEHNAKALKRGLQNGRISYEGYKEMCSQMENYVSIPGKRLARLARKYLHHTRMKEVEAAIRASRRLDDQVYELLDRMEDFQQTRTMRWEQRMEMLAGEREEIAKLLVKTLEMIEHETGIFLIKPIMSIPSRRRIGSGYIVSRRVKSPKDDGFTREQSSGFLAPHSTPSPSARRSPHRRTIEPGASIQSLRRLNSDELQMNVKSMLAENGTTDSVWKVQSSLSGPLPIARSLPNIPKIMELDVNRSMFANNLVSTRLPSDTDTTSGPLHSNVLSYITVTRPSGEIGKQASTRFDQSTGTGNESSPPPPSPYEENNSTQQIRKPQSPLPPIRPSPYNDDGRSVSTYLSDAERVWSPVIAH
ncbi:myosin-10-like [Rhopilema esculentum]|uniref:myosin-10-like n=1 Tax=Rhopilema esculentum TaxID=499914 RepID=UPI0031D4006B